MISKPYSAIAYVRGLSPYVFSIYLPEPELLQNIIVDYILDLWLEVGEIMRIGSIG